MRNFAGDLAQADRCDVRPRGRSILPVLAALVVIGRTRPLQELPTSSNHPHTPRFTAASSQTVIASNWRRNSARRSSFGLLAKTNFSSFSTCAGIMCSSSGSGNSKKPAPWQPT